MAAFQLCSICCSFRSCHGTNEPSTNAQVRIAEQACQEIPLPCYSNRGFLPFEQNLLCKDGHKLSYFAEASLPLLPLWAPSSMVIDESSSGLHREVDKSNFHFRAFPNLDSLQKSQSLHIKSDQSNSEVKISQKLYDMQQVSVDKSIPHEFHDLRLELEESKSQVEIALSLHNSYAFGYDTPSWKLSQTCPARVNLAVVRQLHVSMVLQGVNLSVDSVEFLISLYSKCGSLEDITQIFHKVPHRDLSTWHTIISAFSFFRDNAMVLEMFFEILEEGISPSPFIFICVFRACGYLQDLESGKFLHDQLVVRGLEIDSGIGSALTDMYAKCGSMDEACKTFESLSEESSELWDAIIAGYARHGHVTSAFQLFEEMRKKGFEPRKSTFSCILKLCGETKALGEGRFIHDQVIKSGFQPDIYIGNALLTMYIKCGKLEEACHVFEDFQNHDAVSWGILMRGYVQHGHAASVFKLFERMQEEGTGPNKAVFLCLLNACASLGSKAQGKLIHDHILNTKLDADMDIGSTLIDMYAKCGDLKEARHVFDGLQVRNVVSWNAMITGYVNSDLSLVALNLFGRMQHEGNEPNHITFLGTLRACGKIGALGQVMLQHDLIIRHSLDSNTALANALMDSYCKCGRLEEARNVLNKLTTRNVVSWGGMMAGYAQNGDSQSIKECLDSMQQEGLKPDALIYTSTLAACSHEGNVEAGIGYFRSMKQYHGLSPGIEHFNCMVNLLGDAGHINEADELTEVMPVPPDTTTWLTLLRACRKYCKVSLGRACFDRVYELDFNCAAAYLLMSSIYVDACMWEDAKKIRALRESIGVWKKPGKAWIEINQKVHEFVVGDRTHPQSECVYAKLESLRESMKEEGYMPQISTALDSCSAKEDALCGHSERLAVAFGILSTPEGTTIRVRKNLRVCSDCHKTFKFVAKVEKRLIFLKDSNRSHYFEHGRCSCGDRY